MTPRSRHLALFARLPWIPAAAHLGMRATRAVLRARSIEHYSQFGEDIRLWALLGQPGRRPGRYIDVGANHPVHFSNTYRLYLEGWTGLTIDGNPAMVALHRRLRPRDTAVCAVVSDAERDVSFASLKADCLSRIASPGDLLPAGQVRRVTARPLEHILADCGWPVGRYDVLNVDVEGGEEAVLRGAALDRYRPDVVAVEIHDMDLRSPAASPAAALLLTGGYRLDAYYRPTAIFVLDRRMEGIRR